MIACLKSSRVSFLPSSYKQKDSLGTRLNDNNDLEKIIASHEWDKDKELQHMFGEITGDEGTGP